MSTDLLTFKELHVLFTMQSYINNACLTTSILFCSRRLLDPIRSDADTRRHPAIPYRAGDRTEDAPGLSGSVDHDTPVARWRRRRFLHRHLLRRTLL